MTLLLAASALDSVKDVTPQMWLKIGIGIVAFVIAVIVLRRIAQMNKIVMGVLIFVVVTVVFFSWVYNRNEPRFLTPLVNKIAPFFPSAGAYGDKQKK